MHRESSTVKVTASTSPQSPSTSAPITFEDLKLAPALLKAVRDEGYTSPTPIQAQAIPLVAAGHDLLGGAQTGTGKTAAFVLPLLHRLTMSRSATNRFGGTGIRVLVLTPTRELAAQVEESVRTYGKYLQLSSTVIFGGVGMNPQIDRLRKGVDILVATPGRLLDLQGQGQLDLSTVQALVLDEADRMLDMGFIHDVKKVLALLPANKQSLLFSATFSDEIRDLATGLLRNPQQVQVTPRNTTVQRIQQVIHPVGRSRKMALLAHVVQQHNWSQVLVFTRTKFGANKVADYLNQHGITAMALHGNKSQGARTDAPFKQGLATLRGGLQACIGGWLDAGAARDRAQQRLEGQALAALGRPGLAALVLGAALVDALAQVDRHAAAAVDGRVARGHAAHRRGGFAMAIEAALAARSRPGAPQAVALGHPQHARVLAVVVLHRAGGRAHVGMARSQGGGGRTRCGCVGAGRRLGPRHQGSGHQRRQQQPTRRGAPAACRRTRQAAFE